MLIKAIFPGQVGLTWKPQKILNRDCYFPGNVSYLQTFMPGHGNKIFFRQAHPVWDQSSLGSMSKFCSCLHRIYPGTLSLMTWLLIKTRACVKTSRHILSRWPKCAIMKTPRLPILACLVLHLSQIGIDTAVYMRLWRDQFQSMGVRTRIFWLIIYFSLLWSLCLAFFVLFSALFRLQLKCASECLPRATRSK